MEDGGVYTCRAGNEANYVFSQWVEVQVQSPIRKQGRVHVHVCTYTYLVYIFDDGIISCRFSP